MLQNEITKIFRGLAAAEATADKNLRRVIHGAYMRHGMAYVLESFDNVRQQWRDIGIKSQRLQTRIRRLERAANNAGINNPDTLIKCVRGSWQIVYIDDGYGLNEAGNVVKRSVVRKGLVIPGADAPGADTTAADQVADQVAADTSADDAPGDDAPGADQVERYKSVISRLVQERARLRQENRELRSIIEELTEERALAAI